MNTNLETSYKPMKRLKSLYECKNISFLLMPIAPMLFAWQKFEDTLRNITIYSQRKELKRYIPKIR